ncbi:nucleotidyltransferase domain-containing protein [Actinopolymorpha sp. B17G11]|uniref:nucleotidyltransferase domain-containing protein n=1 Tax=Actinopolymorpha sp. B17G11 TaxID=3160861 RepID=UPI0032E398F4
MSHDGRDGRGDPIVDARDVVVETFPHARWALLSGSVITTPRTAGSDLDIVVLLPDGDPEAPHRASRHFRGWPVELFVHDEETLAHYLTKELPDRRPALNRMVATGVHLVGDRTHSGEIQTLCTNVLAGGPAPLTDTERNRIRYQLTDLLDDLTHATDPAERTVVAAAAWAAAGERVLALNGRWTGTGKWLLRELIAYDPELAERWLAAHADPTAIARFLTGVLDRSGGPLFAGYKEPGERPSLRP